MTVTYVDMIDMLHATSIVIATVSIQDNCSNTSTSQTKSRNVTKCLN